MRLIFTAQTCLTFIPYGGILNIVQQPPTEGDHGCEPTIFVSLPEQLSGCLEEADFPGFRRDRGLCGHDRDVPAAGQYGTAVPPDHCLVVGSVGSDVVLPPVLFQHSAAAEVEGLSPSPAAAAPVLDLFLESGAFHISLTQAQKDAHV